MEETIEIRGGAHLPAVGLGLWKLGPKKAPALVQEALRAGYRHLDSACDYGNEREVGAGIAAALEAGVCRREDLWVTSKLWNTDHAPEHVAPALERTLSDLGLDYLDLYLIHFPIALKHVPAAERYPPGWFFDPRAEDARMEFARVPLAETWRAMEAQVSAGKVRHIGVCNCGTALLRDLANGAEIPPAVLQVELHPYLVQEKLVRYCQQEGIAVTAFSPLGAPSYIGIGMAAPEESVLEQETLREIASRHGVTPAQVALRWGVQRGTAVVPKTARPERLTENLDLFGFALDESEMAAVSALDRGRRFNDPGVFCEGAFNTFCPIYE